MTSLLHSSPIISFRVAISGRAQARKYSPAVDSASARLRCRRPVARNGHVGAQRADSAQRYGVLAIGSAILLREMTSSSYQV